MSSGVVVVVAGGVGSGAVGSSLTAGAQVWSAGNGAAMIADREPKLKNSPETADDVRIRTHCRSFKLKLRATVLQIARKLTGNRKEALETKTHVKCIVERKR